MKEYQYFDIKNADNYPDGTALEVVWKDIFMPFDVIKGFDICSSNPKYKNRWWVMPKTVYEGGFHRTLHDISMFIPDIPIETFTSLDKAIDFCFKWRNNWLNNELLKDNGYNMSSVCILKHTLSHT